MKKLKILLIGILLFCACFLLLIYIKPREANMNLLYGNSNGNIINGGYVQSMNDFIFINDSDTSILYKYNIKDNKKTIISKDCKGNLNISNEALYYISTAGIICSDFNGNIIEIYYDSPCSFIICNNIMYLADNQIYGIDLYSKQRNRLNSINSSNINISNKKIYYTSSDRLSPEMIDDYNRFDMWGDIGEIYQMDLDGSNNGVLINKIVFNLIYYEDYLYYISAEEFKIERLNINTKEVQTISDNIYHNFNIKDNQIVCSNSTTIDILNIEGEIVNSFYQDDGFRDTNINLVDEYIFFHRFGTNEIKMIDLTTSNLRTVIEELPIENDSIDQIRKTKISFDYSTEGAILTGIYSKSNELQYLDIDLLGEMGRHIYQYTWIEDSIIYCDIKISYEEPFYIDPQNIKIKDTIVKKYMIHSGNMYDTSAGDSIVLVSQEFQDETIAGMQEFIKALEE